MDKQLSIFDVDDEKSVSSTNAVEDAKMAAIQRYLDRATADPVACVSEYSPSRRKQKYFRLCYRRYGKVRCHHIPGGNVNSKLAQYRARKLRELIARGAELDEVIAQVQTYAQGGL